MAEIGEVVVSSSVCVFEWRIPTFVSLPFEAHTYCISPKFYFGGDCYFLLFFPNGIRTHDTVGYVGIYLRRLLESGPLTSLEVTFRVKALNAEIERHNAEKICVDEEGEMYGVHRLLSRSELIQRKSELLSSNVLTIVCTVESAKTLENESEPSTSGTSIITPEKELIRDFRELLLKKEDCDVTLKVKGQEFPAHKIILKARSPVFASTFRSDMKEKKTGVVDIEDCDPSSFSDFLSFLYCADVDNLTKENVFNLFTIADKYDVQGLRTMCLEFMKKNLSVDIFCDTLTLALLHSEADLIKLATDFFTKNAPKIVVTNKWQLFLAENPTHSNELLIKLLVPNKNKNVQN